MSERPVTAQLSRHARQRAAEMGVPTKWIKHMIRNPDLCRPGRAGRMDDWLVVSDAHPDIAVVYRQHPNGEITVLTVLRRTYEEYTR